MKQIHCDLAVEAREMITETEGEVADLPGIEVLEEETDEHIRITRVCVKNKEGSMRLGKKVGNYVTVEVSGGIYGQQVIYEAMCKACAKVLTELTNPILRSENDTVLVVGLGNWNITADALGPKVMDSLMITRHLKEYMPEEIDEGIRPVCGVTPGVLGLTGVETGEIIRGIVDRVKPCLVIAIDALCSRKIQRIHTTIQFSDTGITPGEGVGNKRQGITKNNLGVPVVAIGVPTVVDAATIANEAILQVIETVKHYAKGNHGIYDLLHTLEEQERYELVKESIEPSFGNFIVAPKEVDTMVEDIASVIANGINIALHKGIHLQDIDRYV